MNLMSINLKKNTQNIVLKHIRTNMIVYGCMYLSREKFRLDMFLTFEISIKG